MDDDTLRRRIRHKLQAGLLPRHLPPPDPIGTGPGASPLPGTRVEPGTGAPCAACEEVIAPADVLEEVAYPSGPRLQLHAHCYQIWDDERQAG